jgi:hypothetical protein
MLPASPTWRVILDPRHRLLKAAGDFLVDLAETGLVWYLGHEGEALVLTKIEVVSPGCFNRCQALLPGKFEPHCHLESQQVE